MFSVYQPWDPLKVCAVGRSYPPEFYTWIKIPKVRTLFEQIAIETEEDYQAIIKKLQEFGVKTVRSNPVPLADQCPQKFLAPPMNPRDCMVMIGNVFYTHVKTWHEFYQKVKDKSWPAAESINDLEEALKKECMQAGWQQQMHYSDPWKPIVDLVRDNNNPIRICDTDSYVNGASVSRIGRDLYFSIYNKEVDYKPYLKQEFSNYRSHVIHTLGHGDGTYCPVCPGLIISLKDIETYKDTFPGWEVIYLPDQSWNAVRPFLDLKRHTGGKWWIPGWEYDNDVVDVVETWMSTWVGYVEETVFDVNMLVIDPKNILVFSENKKVFDALDRYGITPHVVPFRHRYFWDGGIHCVTVDLDREGSMQDYFPDRSFNDFNVKSVRV